MTLDQIAGKPTLVETIGGQTYRFGRLPLGASAALQNWAREHIPSPLQAIKDQLDGLAPEDRRYLLDQARADMRFWPPDPETPGGIGRLMSTDAGQAACFRAAIGLHQPGIASADADRIFKALGEEATATVRPFAKAVREAERGRNPKAIARATEAHDAARAKAEARMTRIFAVAFGIDIPDDSEDAPGPKDEAEREATTSPSNGHSSSDCLSNV